MLLRLQTGPIVPCHHPCRSGRTRATESRRCRAAVARSAPLCTPAPARGASSSARPRAPSGAGPPTDARARSSRFKRGPGRIRPHQYLGLSPGRLRPGRRSRALSIACVVPRLAHGGVHARPASKRAEPQLDTRPARRGLRRADAGAAASAGETPRRTGAAGRVRGAATRLRLGRRRGWRRGRRPATRRRRAVRCAGRARGVGAGGGRGPPRLQLPLVRAVCVSGQTKPAASKCARATSGRRLGSATRGCRGSDPGCRCLTDMSITGEKS